MTYYVIAFLTFLVGLLLRIRAAKARAHKAAKSCLVDRLVEACFVEEYYRSTEADPYSIAYAAEERHELQTEVSLL
jgi:hypothetical protein